MTRDEVPEKWMVMGCCLGMVSFALIGSLKLAETHTRGFCTVNAPGVCARSCPDGLFSHCQYAPLYANTSFAWKNMVKNCEWSTTSVFLINETCQRALQSVGFRADCAEFNGLCFDRFLSRMDVAVGAVFLVVSGCYTIFTTFLCFSFWREGNAERQFIQVRDNYKDAGLN